MVRKKLFKRCKITCLSLNLVILIYLVKVRFLSFRIKLIKSIQTIVINRLKILSIYDYLRFSQSNLNFTRLALGKYLLEGWCSWWKEKQFIF